MDSTATATTTDPTTMDPTTTDPTTTDSTTTDSTTMDPTTTIDISGTSFDGPEYKYYNFINTPSEMGMSDEGTFQAFGKDFVGMVSYVQMLAEGKGPASKTGQPLGNKFFLKTEGTCMDVETNQEVERHSYFNNVPLGNIPFISSGMGVNFSEFKGIIPGILNNISNMNIGSIFTSAFSGSAPPCQKITMETIDENNNASSEEHYVALVDIVNMDPCSFPNQTHPITKALCKNAFQNMNENQYERVKVKEKDPIIKFFYICISLLGVYIIYKMSQKKI
jgi:hypothetical protein